MSLLIGIASDLAASMGPSSFKTAKLLHYFAIAMLRIMKAVLLMNRVFFWDFFILCFDVYKKYIAFKLTFEFKLEIL